MPSDDIITGPTLNAALVHVVYPSGVLGPKASGTILAVGDDLYLLTNWHVVTGRHWQTPLQRAEWQQHNGDAINWISASECHSPRGLRVSVYAMAEQRVLTQIELEDESAGDPDPRYAWDSSDMLLHDEFTMPGQDVVCVHLGAGLQALCGRLSAISGKRIRLGYDYWESGLDHGAAVGDRIFVVGYPRDIGRRVTDPPVWTGGSMATDPSTDWEGERYLIDARTRTGQSGSAVIAYAPAAGGLPSRAQLLGLYSGRIDEKADIGSAWRVDHIVDDLVIGKRRPRRVVRYEDPGIETLLFDD